MTNLKMTLALTSSILCGGAASAAEIGVVGLYQNGAQLNEAAATDLGCVVQRTGSIVAMQGKLSPELTQPDQFVVLACEQSILGDTDRRAALAALANGSEPVGLFEGALTDFEELGNAQEASGRQYVLKLGYYNNADIDARNAALMALDAKASERDGVWTTESFLQVHTASGIATPDEVVVIYYDSAAIAGGFRDDNPDILEDVTAFNMEHLTDFIYLVGMLAE